jgi:two-component system sensor histidine kinase DesK
MLLVNQTGDAGQFMVIFPSMAAVMVLPLVVPAGVGFLVVTGLCVAVGSHSWGDASSIFLSGFFSGLVMFVLRRLFTTIGLLREAREELARAAVAEERLRFSRDLHDLLGHTLSAVVVKAEVVRRLAERNPAQAAEAAADIETIGRQALVEVREAVTGYRERDLAAELDGARAALSDAGIAPTVRRAAGTLDDRADALLGWAVREGATNVIRHSRATCCTISLRYDDDRAVLQIADDGTGRDGGAPGSAGNGLRGLAERFAAVGGTVRAEAVPGGGFTLTATVPTRVEQRAVDKMYG